MARNIMARPFSSRKYEVFIGNSKFEIYIRMFLFDFNSKYFKIIKFLDIQ